MVLALVKYEKHTSWKIISGYLSPLISEKKNIANDEKHVYLTLSLREDYQYFQKHHG